MIVAAVAAIILALEREELGSHERSQNGTCRSSASLAHAETRIVSWNAEATMYETMEKGGAQIKRLDADLKPDILRSRSGRT